MTARERSDEFAFESTDDLAFDVLDKFGAQLDDGVDADEGRSLIERYVSGEVTVWVKLWTRDVVVETGEYLLIFEALPHKGHVFGQGNEEDGIVRRSPCVAPLDGSNAENEFAMLVDNVELLENPQRVAFPVIPSLIRLYLVKQAHCISGDAAADVERGRLHTTSTRVVLTPTASNRKLSAVGRHAPGGNDQLVSEMVKGRSQVVNGVSEDQGAFDGNGPNLGRPVDMLSTFVVYLSSDSVRLTFEEVGLELFEDFEMELGSAYFGTDSIHARLLYRSHDGLTLEDDDRRAAGRTDAADTGGRDDPHPDTEGRLP